MSNDFHAIINEALCGVNMIDSYLEESGKIVKNNTYIIYPVIQPETTGCAKEAYMQYPKVKIHSLGILSLFAGMLLVSSPLFAADRVIVVPLNSGGGDATGNAVAADVLAGKTFSNASDNGIAGTMPNRGAESIVPAEAPRTIPKGYHDGDGKVIGDADLTPDNIKVGVTVFGVLGGYVGAGDTYNGAEVPKTGQTTSYDTNTPQADDGALQQGVAWPDPRFLLDTVEGTVFDNMTGLTWLRDANCMKTNYPEVDLDPDNVDPPTPPYTCPGPEDPNGCGNGRVYWQHALDFVAGVNAGTYPLCNSTTPETDWRLPNRFELESLLDLEQSDPALPLGHPFTNVVQLIYWSSSTFDSDHNAAWGVHFQQATVHHQLKPTNPHFVMLVRGGQ